MNRYNIYVFIYLFTKIKVILDSIVDLWSEMEQIHSKEGNNCSNIEDIPYILEFDFPLPYSVKLPNGAHHKLDGSSPEFPKLFSQNSFTQNRYMQTALVSFFCIFAIIR
jgi:hypothetical protein